MIIVVVFFFKTKTAYDMRSSDWSSDVCSSDLGPRLGWGDRGLTSRQQKSLLEMQGVSVIDVRRAQKLDGRGDIWAHAYWYGNSWVSSDVLRLLEIGRASCRERVCQDV